MYWCLLPLIHPSLASIMAILKVWWSVYQFGPDWNLSNNYWKDCTMNFVQTLMIPWGWTWLTAEASRSHLCHLRCRFICNFYWSIRCFWFYLQWALQLHRVSRPYSSAIENGLTCSVSHCKFSFLFLCWWFHNENSFLTRSDQVSGEDLTVSALSSTLPFPATPSHWRLEFIVMVTAVCIIHAGGGCKVDGQRLTGDTVRRALVGCNSVGLCYRYWRRLRYRIHTGLLFVCGLASFDCIMYSKTSDKPLEMASNGTGQSTNEPVIWYQRSRGMSAVLFTLLIQYSHFTMFDLLLFFPFGPELTSSSWAPDW